ncbi:flagellar hook-length control protein FliK [Marinospirillum sp. MEB164]|uniref:Flagellar hook-length control protein FliK n=1 Tax=Marinospirillum alkalitolerans TaxID=3123374 RepID=A0ABW8PU63_9GAMM
MQGVIQTSHTSSPSVPTSTGSFLVSGQPSLPAGQTSSAQVISSEARPQGQYQVQVQLSQGQTLTLTMDKPLPAGQQLVLTGRQDGQLEVRLLPNNPTLSNLPLPPLPVQGGPLTGLPTPAQLTAQLLYQQALPAGQGVQLTLQLASGTQLTLNAPQALSLDQWAQSKAGLTLHLSTSGQAQLHWPQSTAAQPASPTQAREAASLQSLLASAGAQLRHALPRQAPLGQVFQQLSQLLPQLPLAAGRPASGLGPTLGSSGLPPAGQTTASVSASGPASQTTSPQQPLSPQLSQLLVQLMSRPIQGEQPPQAQQISQFVPYHGGLLEANLLRGIHPAQQGDLKFLLQQASSLLRHEQAHQPASRQPVLQQLQQQLQAAEARIQVLQQASLQATQTSFERGQPMQLLQLDLPFSVRGEWLHVQLDIRRWIEEEEAEAEREEKRRATRLWQINLHFDLQAMGKLTARLKLKEEELTAAIWINEESSYQQLREHVTELVQRLERTGAKIKPVEYHLGQPPLDEPPPTRQSIIDTRI